MNIVLIAFMLLPVVRRQSTKLLVAPVLCHSRMVSWKVLETALMHQGHSSIIHAHVRINTTVPLGAKLRTFRESFLVAIAPQFHLSSHEGVNGCERCTLGQLNVRN